MAKNGQNYAPHDLTLIKELTFEFTTAIKGKDEKDKLTQTSFSAQFPPKILTDSRKGNWVESEIPGREPAAVYKNSSAREFAMQFTYIIDGGQWTSRRIADLTHQARGYFARVRDDSDQRNLIVYLKYIGYGGVKPQSCYIRGIDVKHSDNIILDSTNIVGPLREDESRHGSSFPLRTDITFDMRMWNIAETQDVEGVIEVEPEWY
tara:strand:- start:528 stop:1145 length:618 start_codon:yes stop_codon:yes gene_type:complete